MNATPVTLVHDYITQRGGAERVVLALHNAFPRAPIVTALFRPKSSFPEFGAADVRSSLLNRLPALRRNPQLALAVLPLAWSLRKPLKSKYVLISSSGWAHGIRVAHGSRKIVYCHNPPRWLYQSEDYLIGRGRLVKSVLKVLTPALRAWDRKAADTVDLYIANSSSVRNRIRAVYGRDAVILHPPVMIDPTGPQEQPAEGLPSEFFLAVGRRRGYKGLEGLIEAFSKMPEKNLIIVGAEPGTLPPNVISFAGIPDASMRWLYAHATALLSISREDFGLSPLEANAFGVPALVVRAGGFLDSISEGISGKFFEGVDSMAIIKSIQSFPSVWDTKAIQAHAAKFDEAAFSRSIRALLDHNLPDGPLDEVAS